LTLFRIAAMTLAAVAGTLGGWLFQTQASADRLPPPHTTRPGLASPSPSPTPGAKAPVYLDYYMWWSTQHWHDKLGPNYPYATLPIPGTVDATGCNPRVYYKGAQIVDIPTEGLYDQAQASTFDRHISQATAAGVSGFLASWEGTGASTQGPTSSGYNSRFDLLVSRVDAYDQAHPGGFGLGLALDSFGNFHRPASQLIADLKYFAARYGGRPAFRNRFSGKPMVMWLDSWKFSPATVSAVSRAMRSQVYLVGDEKPTTWARDASFLDATSYYWSSENPWQNNHAGANLANLANTVRAQGKLWFAPFNAGYDRQLGGGICVARQGTATLKQVWKVNSQSRPAAWFGISWNEFVEGTYMEPTRTYGTTYVDALAALIKAA
jgi:hypothetical protein